MTIPEILNTTGHRPWPLPPGNWKYYQEWNNAIFLHWQVEYDTLAPLVPALLEIDLFEGKPWVSLVAFTMERIRPRNLPAVKQVSDFHEVNVRTYVRGNGKAGVYFLSIEGGKRISCRIARSISELPYRFSKMSRTAECFRSVNKAQDDYLEIRYKIGEALKEKTDLDRWLTERYALFQDAGSRICSYKTHHLEWRIRELEINRLIIDYGRFDSLMNNAPDRVHYSPGVQVLAWGRECIGD